MSGHDAVQRLAQPAKRRSIFGQQRFKRTAVYGNVGVGICFDKAMPRKMLAATGHTGLQQAMHQAFGQQGDHPGVARKRPVAYDAALAKAKVQHRCEAEVHSARPELRGQHEATGGGRSSGGHRVMHPLLTQLLHGRHMGKAIRFKTLNTPAFVVHANEQVLPDFFDLPTQLGELGAILPVAGKQNHAAHQRVLESVAVGAGERGARNVNDQWGMHRGFVAFTFCGFRGIVQPAHS